MGRNTKGDVRLLISSLTEAEMLARCIGDEAVELSKEGQKAFKQMSNRLIREQQIVRKFFKDISISPPEKSGVPTKRRSTS